MATKKAGTITKGAKAVPKKKGEHKGKFSHKNVQSALEIAQGSKTVAAQILCCSRSTLDRYISRYPSLAEVYGDLLNGHLDEIESAVFSTAKKGNMVAATFVLRTLGRNRGYVESKPQNPATAPNSEVQATLTSLLNGEISVSDAAIKLEIMGHPIPETIRTLLAKEDRQPPDPSAGHYASISEEEFERRAAARKAELAQQREGLEPRREEVKTLREEMRDTFAPGHDGEEHA